ncbi:MAG: sel1 repeat family protein [Burkholderiales bacterium]|jgi:TPR repeat protein|nr:sel1 repeat family protein [Burkholderiales bacterium]
MKNKDAEKFKKRYMESVFIKADWLFDIGYSKLAYKLYSCLADEGHEDSLNRMGDLFLSGNGIKKDANKAIIFYKKAIKKGNALAMYNAAFVYKNVLKEYKSALYYLRNAQKSSDLYVSALAYIEEAEMYLKGIGVKRNLSKARKLLHVVYDDDTFFYIISEDYRDKIEKMFIDITCIEHNLS